MYDPLLTELGKEQCASLASSFQATHPSSSITHIVASPLRRTIYTALYSFPTEVSKGVRIIALPELQETSGLPCDTGSDPKDLAAEFAAGEGEGKYKDVVDLDLVADGWNVKEGRWSPASSAIEARARVARQFLLKLGQDALSSGQTDKVEIAVVTHGGYLHYFTEDWDGHAKFMGTGWSNTETRSYEFVSGAQEGAAIKETKESREQRRGKEIELTEDEQRELRASAESEWRDRGLQLNEEAKL